MKRKEKQVNMSCKSHLATFSLTFSNQHWLYRCRCVNKHNYEM